MALWATMLRTFLCLSKGYPFPIMKPLWQRSLVFKSTLGIVGAALVVGMLMLLVAVSVATGIAGRHTQARLGQLADTVESTISIACFLEDPQLATEIISGLMKNNEVGSAQIRTASRKRLAEQYRREAKHANDAVIHTIYSPFNPKEIVGEVEIHPDPLAVAVLADEGVRYMATIIFALLAAVGATVVLYVLFKIVRPIKALSDHLHHLDATKGEVLSTPRGHPHDELGRLTGDINELLGKLVSALQVEQVLSHQRAIDEKKYRDLFENAETGIFIATAEGQITSYNRAFSVQTGLSQPTEGDRRLSLLSLGWLGTDMLKSLLGHCLHTGQIRSEDFEFRLRNGDVRWFNLTLTPVSAREVQGTIMDVTRSHLAEHSAKLAAVTDTLTGLPNRIGLEQHVDHLLLHTHDPNFAFLLIDIDGFKQFNDAFGFPVGDQILLSAAARLQSCLKQQDILARIGGDEFAVCLLHVGRETATAVAQRIVETLSREFSINSRTALLGASIGMTFYPHDSDKFPLLLRNSELALEALRNDGQSKSIRCYNSKMSADVESRQYLLADLRLAPYRGELLMYYQPIIDLQARRVVGAEALIRWQHPERGLVPPDAFIPLAEKSGLIEDIGLWCLDTACRQLADWRQQALDLCLTINVSARQIPDALPVEILLATMSRYGLQPADLGLEITEGVLLTDISAASTWLDSVRQAGFMVYLDDFGTGYSSLSYLKRFRVDKVKIDKSFVRDVRADNSDRALIESVLILAESLQFKVVAEGIEEADQAELLTRLGCQYGQGYFYSRPVPATEFLATLARLNQQFA